MNNSGFYNTGGWNPYNPCCNQSTGDGVAVFAIILIIFILLVICGAKRDRKQ